MDAITLEHMIAEARAVLVGRHLGRVKLAAAHALLFEVSGDRERRLWLDAGRGTAGLYLLPREEARAAQEEGENAAPGRTRQALLLFRKHLHGARIAGLARIPGERALVLEASGGLVSLRLSGPSPALSLVVDGTERATVGEGSPAWPLPPSAVERDWDRIEPRAFAAAVAEAVAAGKTPVRAILGVCPSLGPLLARALDAACAPTAGVGNAAESLLALRVLLAAARPTLLAPGPVESWHDADLAAPSAVALAPVALEHPGRVALHLETWTEAAALFLRARRRGARFEGRRRAALESARRELRRLVQLEAHLGRDLAGLGDAGTLRHQAEALLAASAAVGAGASEVVVPDPYLPDARLRIALSPVLTLPGNADRLFARARRIERARLQVEARLAETRRAIEEARLRESRALAARDALDLETAPAPARRGAGALAEEPSGPRQYLTSSGLSILVGRGARENHHLTFGVARPEDVWLHVRDTPGAHVILRDPEARAAADDLREAAELAAFFSDARSETWVDVHVTRRKHLRPARGGSGRVVIGHSDTLRVTPRDPEGRLRRR